jgi:hypothetical protein
LCPRRTTPSSTVSLLIPTTPTSRWNRSLAQMPTTKSKTTTMLLHTFISPSAPPAPTIPAKTSSPSTQDSSSTLFPASS